MESYTNFISSSDNTGAQIQSGKRPQASSLSEGFGMVSSKKDLYEHMTDNLQVCTLIISLTFLQYYMPSFEMFTKDFAKEVFSGSKKLLKLREVKFISVKKYDELSVKNLYGNFLELEGMIFYFPDKYPKGRQCDREYMFDVANTLYENITNELIRHSLL